MKKMADYSNNSNQYQNRVSTSGITLFDENGIMLKLGYLDDALSLLIGEPVTADNGKRSYPQEKRHPFLITADRATALYERILMKKVIPAVENKEDYNGGIFLNKRKDAIFEFVIQNGDVYLVYHTGIGEDRKPSNSYVFKCSNTTLIQGYKPDGSTDFSQESVNGVFFLVCKYFEMGAYEVIGGVSHSVRKGLQYINSSIFNHLKGIAAKLGVTINRPDYGNSNTSSGFMNIPDGAGDELPFDTETIPAANNLEDLIS